jgi:hypothetical protein
VDNGSWARVVYEAEKETSPPPAKYHRQLLSLPLFHTFILDNNRSEREGERSERQEEEGSRGCDAA